MKKFICLALALMIAVSLAACGKEAAKVQAPEGTPVELIEKLYAGHREIPLSLITVEADLQDKDYVAYNLGLESVDRISTAALSETMMGQPYSLVMARVKNAADAEQLARELYEKIDTNKWICMEADTKTAAYCGDVVMFFMVSSEFAEAATTESVMEAFNALCGGKAIVVG